MVENKLDMLKIKHHVLLSKECLGNLKCIFPEAATAGFCKKGVLKNFAKFAGKCPCQSLFFNKAAGLSL